MGFDGFLSKPVAFDNVKQILGLNKSLKIQADFEEQKLEESLSSALNVSVEIIDQGIEASKIYHISKLTQCIEAIENSGSFGKKKAKELKQFLKDLNMEAMARSFEKLREQCEADK